MRSLNTVRLRCLLLIVLFTTLSSLSGCSSIGAAMEASPSLGNFNGIWWMEMDDLKKRYTNEDSRFMEVNDYNIHYRDVGEGEPIILMHGIFSSLHTWDGWVERLKGSHRVITLDMPGYGLTGGPPNLEDFNYDSMLETVTEFIDELELERVSLAGNSLGGMIAARYAAKYPGRVRKLLLLDPFGYPQDTPFILSLATFPPVAMMGQFIQPAWIVTLNVRWVYGDPARITDEAYHRYVHMNQRKGAKPIYIKTLEMIEEHAEDTETPRPFFRIAAPTLLMWGEEDAWVPLDLARKWLKDIPQARLIVYPTVGHIPMEEIPKATAADALKFFSDGLDAFEPVAQNDPDGGREPESALAAAP